MTDLQAVQQATKTRWSWLRRFWGLREMVELVAMDASDCPKLRDRVHVLELDLRCANAKVQELEQQIHGQKDALAHVGRFIAASHRMTGKPVAGSIKEILYHAQRS